jgi:hypothetical protein
VVFADKNRTAGFRLRHAYVLHNSPQPESNPALTRRPEGSIARLGSAVRRGMIENRGFDSHSLRHLHDFVR